ncbi:MAG: threonine synthase [Actinomycetota bacterium]
MGDNVMALRCRECAREYPVEPIHVCEFCFGPLEVAYDEDRVRASFSRESIAAGPHSMWRYAPLLPASPENRVDLGVGMTPLVPAPRLAEALGLGELYIKNDTRNPSFSFKDRVVSVAITRAREFGFETVACASTGNLANSVAAHAAAAGLKSYVFIPADLEQGKILTTAVYGPNLVAVWGSYDEVNRLCAEVAGRLPWAFVNVNIRPFYAEGSKTIAFEIAEQLDWSLPDHVVVPIASGSLLTKVRKGFGEFVHYGIVPEHPVRISGAQASGCAPVSSAFKAGVEHIRPVKPDTIAKSLAIGNPADGYYACRAVRETGGAIEDVSDEEIWEAMLLLASTEGIFGETAAGVTIATLKRLAQQGVVGREERVVALVTGLGLKTLEAVAEHVGPTMTIAPKLEEFEERLSSLG